MKIYNVQVERDRPSKLLVAQVIELPGCFTQAPDAMSLEVNLREAVTVYRRVRGDEEPEGFGLQFDVDLSDVGSLKWDGVFLPPFGAREKSDETVLDTQLRSDRAVRGPVWFAPLELTVFRLTYYFVLQRVAWSAGFHWADREGKHNAFRHADGRVAVVPNYDFKLIVSSLLRRILDRMDMTLDQYAAVLELGSMRRGLFNQDVIRRIMARGSADGQPAG